MTLPIRWVYNEEVLRDKPRKVGSITLTAIPVLPLAELERWLSEIRREIVMNSALRNAYQDFTKALALIDDLAALRQAKC